MSTEDIAALRGVTDRRARKYLCHLLELGLIRVVKFDGRKRYIESTISFRAEWNNRSGQDGLSVSHTDNNEYIYNNSLSNRGSSHFQKTSIYEIRQYCLSRDNRVDLAQFFNFYESKGWMVGKSKMKDWKASVRTWEKREKEVPQRKREFRRESVLEHNFKVMDQMFGTNLHAQAYGKKEVNDEQ